MVKSKILCCNDDKSFELDFHKYDFSQEMFSALLKNKKYFVTGCSHKTLKSSEMLLSMTRSNKENMLIVIFPPHDTTHHNQITVTQDTGQTCINIFPNNFENL